jgi:hypothetical protein
MCEIIYKNYLKINISIRTTIDIIQNSVQNM